MTCYTYGFASSEEKRPRYWSYTDGKAKVLFTLLYPESEKAFTESTRFQWRFCKQHGIRNLSLQGEKASAGVDAADKFKGDFSSLTSYSHDQIYNCNETGLYYCLLLQNTLAGSYERRADGRKNQNIVLQ